VKSNNEFLNYKYYMLALLTMVAAFSGLDRHVLTLALESIRHEFSLNDSQLGLMSGFAFTFFYAIVGIPLARWADRGNRNTVVTVTTGLWSAMLALSALAGNFIQLLLARVGVAVGESGCVPTAQSLISDYFARAERPKAMSIYWMYLPLSTIIAFSLGGWLIEHYGWRHTFIVIGAPGVLLALLVKLTLKEPRLTSAVASPTNTGMGVDHTFFQPTLISVVQALLKRRSFRHISLSFCIAYFFGSGIALWVPAFFIRTHEMGVEEIGLWMAAGWGFGGIFFTFLGGYLATRYAPNNERLQIRCVSFLVVLCTVCHALCYWSDNKIFALIMFSAVTGGLIPLSSASVYAAIQSLVEERMRAVAIAAIFLFANLIGAGLGPVAVGMVSDLLSSSLGDESLRYALLLFSPGYLWCAYHDWQASKTIEEDIRAVESLSQTSKGQYIEAAADARGVRCGGP